MIRYFKNPKGVIREVRFKSYSEEGRFEFLAEKLSHIEVTKKEFIAFLRNKFSYKLGGTK